MNTTTTAPARARPLATATALVGCVAALGYGALKLSWAFGGTIGFRGAPPWETGAGAWGEISDLGRLLALEGTALLAVLAAAILLALVRPWGAALPQRALRALAWLGCLIMGANGLVGSGMVLAEAVGLTDRHEDELALGVYGFVYGCFLVLGGRLRGDRLVDAERPVSSLPLREPSRGVSGPAPSAAYIAMPRP